MTEVATPSTPVSTEPAAETSVDEETLNVDGADDFSMDDADLEAIRARVREMEEEAEKIKQMQSEVERQMNMSTSSTGSLTGAGGPGSSPLTATLSMEEKVETDQRSIYVGNVDYGATAEELEAHFHGCGEINRVTILCDRFSGHPKGFAYVEFTAKESVQTAMALDESLFRGRQIKVSEKRTNQPGISSTNRPPRRRRRRVMYVYGGGGGGFGRRRGFRRRSGFSPY